MSEDNSVRVQKFIADAGIASRRMAEELIRGGEVTINGKKAQLGDKVLAGKDHVKVKGKLIVKMPRKIVIAFTNLAESGGRPRGITQNEENVSTKATVWEFCLRSKKKLNPWAVSARIPKACCCSPMTAIWVTD